MFRLNSINLGGESVIYGKTAVYFNANIPNAGNPTFSKTIADMDTYSENVQECEADYEQFESEALGHARNNLN